jgi:hypothetical protein
MKIRIGAFAVLALLALPGASLLADPVDTVMKGCATEMETFCSQVSPGEGRMLACFYAHEDKLSGQCQYALYGAATELEAALAALDYVATECRDDILEYCAAVEVGEGRVIECLRSNSDSVNASCIKALDDVFE